MFEVDNKRVSKSDTELDSRLQGAITSIFENRLPIFLPIQKLKKSRIKTIFEENNHSLTFDTEFGKIEVSNRLVTQQHKLYLEAMLSYHKHPLTDGSFYVTFRIYDLLKNKLQKENPTDYATFRKYLKELKGVTLTLHTKNDKEIDFGFIDEVIIDTKTGEWQVKFTRAMGSIWLNDGLLDYKNSSDLLSQAKYPVVTSVIRYMITYPNLTIGVDTIAQKLGLKIIFAKTAYHAKLNEIRDSFDRDCEDNALFIYDTYGITYNKKFDNIEITRNENVFIHHKKDSLTSSLINAKKSE